MKSHTKTSLAFFFLFSFFFIAKAQTNVSGGIYANTTWTKTNSPYIVTDTVVVFPGVILTIEPGVEVRFADNMQLEIRQGSLIAQGTRTDSITFTSNSAGPFPGIWSEVFMNQFVNSSISHCNFFYSRNGIRCNGSPSGNLAVTNSRFSFNMTGLSTSTLASFAMDSCLFSVNAGNGVYVYSGMVTNSSFLNNTGIGAKLVSDTIINCVANYNNGGGIQITSGGVIMNCKASYNGTAGFLGNRARIYNCESTNNATGFDINTEGGLFGPNLNVIQNCVSRYNRIGLRTYVPLFCTGCKKRAMIENCQIESNDSVGVMLSGFDTLVKCLIRNNRVGIHGPQAGIVKENLIEGSKIGIYNTAAANRINCNRICNNDSFNVFNATSPGYSCDMKNNDWCTTDSVVIATSIYDGYDNVNLGLGIFMPFDISQCNIPSRVSSLEQLGISIYPNPVSRFLYIAYPENISDLRIFNLLGETELVTSQEQIIDVSSLPTGVYILEATTGNKTERRKFIKL